MKIKIANFYYILFVATFSIQAIPKQVIILRHAEKLINNSISEEQYLKLSEQGKERANALANFFSNHNESNFLKNKIDMIFAVTPRTLQTIAPLAINLKIPVQSYFSMSKSETKIANKLLTEKIMSDEYNGKIIIICWTHSNIPIIAKQLGLENAPKWDKDVYDRFWVLNYLEDGKIEFKNMPQPLLLKDKITDNFNQN